MLYEIGFDYVESDFMKLGKVLIRRGCSWCLGEHRGARETLRRGAGTEDGLRWQSGSTEAGPAESSRRQEGRWDALVPAQLTQCGPASRGSEAPA